MEVHGHANGLPWRVARATEGEKRVSVLCFEEILAQLRSGEVNPGTDSRTVRGRRLTSSGVAFTDSGDFSYVAWVELCEQKRPGDMQQAIYQADDQLEDVILYGELITEGGCSRLGEAYHVVDGRGADVERDAGHVCTRR